MGSLLNFLRDIKITLVISSWGETSWPLKPGQCGEVFTWNKKCWQLWRGLHVLSELLLCGLEEEHLKDWRALNFNSSYGTLIFCFHVMIDKFIKSYLTLLWDHISWTFQGLLRNLWTKSSNKIHVCYNLCSKMTNKIFLGRKKRTPKVFCCWQPLIHDHSLKYFQWF